MTRVSVAQAKARFSRILAEAAAGREVLITRRGTAIARLSGIAQEKKPLDLRAANEFCASLSRSSGKPAAAALIRQVRNARY